MMMQCRQNRWAIAVACLAYLGPGSRAIAQDGQAPVRDPQRLSRKHVQSWKSFRDLHVVKQKRDYSCGAAALATLTRYYWGDGGTELEYLTIIENLLTPEELEDRVENGLSLTDLRKAAVKKGYQASIGKLELQKLYEVKVPIIVAIKASEDLEHFVVVRGIVDNWVYLSDPILGNRRLPMHIFADVWIDNALLAVVEKGKKKAEVSRLGITQREIDTGWLNIQTPRRASERFSK
jgi:hypothetical protein